ncbi:MAG: TIGR03000 domain-containing protein [Pirellulales bacterium]|nr:TIGR03000 domain-containing protein [Pirellulales bacterium]
MRGITHWRMALTVVAAVALFVSMDSNASAYNGYYGYCSSWGCSSGWYGGWDGCYAPVRYYYRAGPIRRALRFIFFPCRRWYSPYYVTSSYYYVPYCDPCCYDCVSYTTVDSCCGGTVVAPETYAPPTPATTPSPTPAETAPAPGPAPAPGEDAATLQLEVPANSRVYVNDTLTKHPGTIRRYVSRGLRPENSYTYNIRVEYLRDNLPVQETRTVRMTAGDHAALTFGQAVTQERIVAKPVDTTVTLHVPAEARVILAGNPTRQVGEIREFTTQRLAPGQAWKNYMVRVEVERNGRTLVQERTLDLAAGNTRELTFSFDEEMKIAQKDH